jgi:RHS repeat-associated protein
VIAYSYDELGRVLGRSINGIGLSLTYDALGRLSGETNALGAFAYGYDGITGRVATIGYPNGQSTAYSYLPNSGDHRLQQVLNQRPGGVTLSSFQYAYDPTGMLTSWTQQTDGNPARAYALQRDPVDRVLAATLTTVDPTPTVLKRYRYVYDGAGNRATEEVDDSAVAAMHDNLNALRALQPGGALSFRGTVSEPATVSVQGKPATVDASNVFAGRAEVGPGTTNVVVGATDASGNTRTNTYQVNVSGSASTLSYDANGNSTSDGVRTFEWDGANRLTAINQGTHRSEFTYDGWGHRVRIVEKTNGAVTSDRRFVWCGMVLCEERGPDGVAVSRRFFGQGMEEDGTDFFYATDHLGNVRELTDVTGALRARYEYDPYGRVTKLSGDKDSVFTFAGLLNHAPSGLLLANYRAYDSNLGRWISQDPIGLAGGINLYAYAGGKPLDAADPLGLFDPAGYGATISGAILTGAKVAVTGAKVTAATIASGVGVMIVALLQTGDGRPPMDPQDETDGSGGTETEGGKVGGPGSGIPDDWKEPTESGNMKVIHDPSRARCQEDCPPCQPPVGTMRVLRNCTTPHYPWKGMHWHIYQMHQSPASRGCGCFWK